MSRNRSAGAARPIPPAFVDDLIADWHEHGREAIQRVRKWAPQRYVHLVAALAPPAASGHEQLDAMTDAEVEQDLRRILTLIDRQGALPAWLRLIDPADI